MEFIHDELIKKFLKDKKYSSLVINSGLNRLIPNWKKIVNDLDNECSIFDYLNDLSGRYIIDEIVGLLNTTEQKRILKELIPTDNQFLTKTFEINECLFQKKAAKYNRDDNWYYFRITKKLFKIENDLRIKNSGKPKYTKKE